MPTATRRCGSTRRRRCTTATCGCCWRPRTPRATSTRRPPPCSRCSTPTTCTTNSPSAARHSTSLATRGKALARKLCGRMTPRWVLHVDLDQFQASVELRRNPELAGLPVIVGGNGDPTEPRKVVTCASYEAREFGVHAGMPLRTAARKCPDATFLPLDTDRLRRGVRRGDGPAARPRPPGRGVGLGRGLSRRRPRRRSTRSQLAEQIREVIAAETGLSCSVGISDNKQRAKVATGFGKPAGIFASPTTTGWR